MLWTLVDVVAVIAAFAAIALLGPEVIGVKNWRRRLSGGRPAEDAEDQSNASPSRESSSST